MKTSFRVEYTDTFGGEANYSWCRRATIEVPQEQANRNAAVTRKAKAALGLTGVPFRKAWDSGDEWRLNEVGACRCMFITFAETLD